MNFQANGRFFSRENLRFDISGGTIAVILISRLQHEKLFLVSEQRKSMKNDELFEPVQVYR